MTRVRKSFPETWIWTTATADENGDAVISSEARGCTRRFFVFRAPIRTSSFEFGVNTGLIVVNPNPQAPDTITSWDLSAWATHPTGGVGIAAESAPFKVGGIRV